MKILFYEGDLELKRRAEILKENKLEVSEDLLKQLQDVLARQNRLFREYKTIGKEVIMDERKEVWMEIVIGRVVKIESFEDQKLRIITIKQSDKKIIEINFWIHGTEYHRNLSSIEIKKAYKINGLHVSKNGEDEFKLTSSFYSVITELQLK